MTIIIPANSAVTAAYDVDNSCRFNDDDSAYMHKSLGTPTSQRKFTFSCWFKPAIAASNNCTLISWGASSDNEFASITIQEGTGYYLQWYLNDQAGSGDGSGDKRTTMLFRDPSAWYHLVCALDTEQDAGADRQKFYVNGVRVTSFTEENWIAEDYDVPALASGETVEIGRRITSGSYHMDGYMAEVCFVDGLQLAPTSFGEFDEDSPTIWKPIDVSGLTFGNNGFYLDFEDSSNLGNDANGGTDLTEVNLAAADQATDTPTNNFATINPLWHSQNTGTMSEGNCIYTSSTSAWGGSGGNIAFNKGKWFWEVQINANTGGHFHGVIDESANVNNNPHQRTGATFYYSGGEMYKDGSGDSGSHGTFGATDIAGVAVNADDDEITIYKNGSAIVTDFALSTTKNLLIPWFMAYNSGSDYVKVNFGGCPPFSLSSAVSDANGYGAFEYAVPSGYYALCTKNLAEYG